MKNNEILLNFFNSRRIYFDFILKDKGINNLFTCPSCGFPSLTRRNSYEICPLCNWEDDGQDDFNADEVLGGPNKSLSLTDSRVCFEENHNYLYKKGNILLEQFQYYNEVFDENLSKDIESSIKKMISFSDM